MKEMSTKSTSTRANNQPVTSTYVFVVASYQQIIANKPVLYPIVDFGVGKTM
jgi:hypothetical protein